MPLSVLLDTDLGSDVDDELALALLWGSPEVAVQGVCTTYGDVALRARIVLRMAELTGRRVVVAPGEAQPASGKPVWCAGTEGDAYDHLPDLPASRPDAGVRLLLAEGPGSHVLAVGPLTTVAAALSAGLIGFASLTVMGGEWSDAAVAEHNLASDTTAARRVLASGLPVSVVGLDVTRQVRFGEAEVERFAACGHLGAIVAAEMRAWMRRWGEDVEVPHDALTALALLRPELFAFAEPCAVLVSDGGDGSPAGAVRRLPEPGGVRIATRVDVRAATDELADRIAHGLGEHRSRAATV